MGFLSVFKKAGPVLALLLFSNAVSAQEDYDPEYDNETAAGKVDTATSGVAPTGENTPDKADASGGVTTAPTDSVGISAGATAASDAEATDESLSATADGALDGFEDADDTASVSNTISDGELQPWNWGAPRHLSSLTGSTGLYHALEAGSDAPGTFGIGIHGAFFKYTDYLIYGDEHVYMWGGLNLRITPIKYLEIFAGLEGRSNTNTKSDPELFQSLGDFNIGLKGNYSPLDLLTLGLVFGLEFKNPVGEVSVAFDGLTFPLGVLATADFSKLNKKVPVRAHLNAIYRFDNSAKLIQDVENSRGGCDTDVNGDGTADYSGCLDPIERKGLEIDRTDQFRIALGVDAAFPYVTPLIEYGIDIPVNRQDFVCPIGMNPGSADSCMDVEGARGMRQFLTLGVRVLPPLKTLTVDLGVDIGLSGYAPSVQELAPHAPYRFLFGVTYNFDPFAAAPKTAPVEPCPPRVEPEPILPQPLIAGYVHDAADMNRPIGGAIVKYMGLEMNSQLSDAQGRFTSYPLPIGQVTLAVHAEGYEDATFVLDIPAPAFGADAQDMTLPPAGESVPNIIKVDCPLTKRQDFAKVTIQVEGQDGALADASVEISDGEDTAGGTTDASGALILEAPAGRYTVMVRKAGYFEKERVIEIAAGQGASIKVVLTEVPAESSVELSKERISIKKRVMFTTGSEEIETESLRLLDEVAAVIKQHPELKKIEIQGHTDNRGKDSVNLALSARRAEAVVAYLVGEGIRSERLTAKGYGATKPRAPNITGSGRAKNRRVEFHILERAE